MSLINPQNGKELSQEARESLDKVKSFVAQKLPDMVVDKVQSMIDDSFRKETYQDGKSTKWQQRKNDSESGKARSDRRALLVKSGRLIKSVVVEKRGDTISINTDVPYAEAHNEGMTISKPARSETFKRNRKGNKFAKGTTSGKGLTFKESTMTLPKRQFMPIPGERNEKLDKEVEKLIDDEMNKIFK